MMGNEMVKKLLRRVTCTERPEYTPTNSTRRLKYAEAAFQQYSVMNSQDKLEEVDVSDDDEKLPIWLRKSVTKLHPRKKVVHSRYPYEMYFEKTFRAVALGDKDELNMLLIIGKCEFEEYWSHMSHEKCERHLYMEQIANMLLCLDNNIGLQNVVKTNEPIQLLELAVLAGNPDIVQCVLLSGVDEVCTRLYERGGDFSKRCSKPWHFLGLSKGTKENLTKIARMLKEVGYNNINSPIRSGGMAPLQYACSYDINTNAIQVLIEAGCDVTLRKSYELTALSIVSSSDCLPESDLEALVQCFLERGYGLDLNEEVYYLIDKSHFKKRILIVMIHYGLLPSMLDDMAVFILCELVKPPADWDMVIALLQLGVKIQVCPPNANMEKVLELQNNIWPLQRLAANVIRSKLHPNFYLKLMKLSGEIPKDTQEYIMMKNLIL